MPRPSYAHAYWPAAGTRSRPVRTAGATPVGFFTPGTVASAAVTFEGCDAEDGTYVPVKDSSGSAIGFTVAASGYYGFSDDQVAAFLGLEFVRLVGGASEAAGSQWKLALRDVA